MGARGTAQKIPLSTGAVMDAPKTGIVGQTLLPDLLWDVLVLGMEKGQLFLAPSATDVL